MSLPLMAHRISIDEIRMGLRRDGYYLRVLRKKNRELSPVTPSDQPRTTVFEVYSLDLPRRRVETFTTRQGLCEWMDRDD